MNPQPRRFSAALAALAALLASVALFCLYVWLLNVGITLLGYSAADTGRTRGWSIFCAYLAASLACVPVFMAAFSFRYAPRVRLALGAQASLVSFFLCVLSLAGLTWLLNKTGLHILSITLLLMRGGTHVFAVVTATTMLVSFLILKPPRQYLPRPRSMLVFSLLALLLTLLFFMDYLGTRGYSLPPWYPWRGVPRFAAAICLALAGTAMLAARGSALSRPLLASLLVLLFINWGRDFLLMGYSALPPLFWLKAVLLGLALHLLYRPDSRAWLKE